ncbi:FHA domain-containing protein [Thermosporothrix hazakensis]|jgi:hypothetical protein|uniref:FHA domain-containing protein n=2 Tax=Thermosporothrix TaxID=768650 RepID=A0A326UQW7_THEHA|nr:FHA domain-containing protein [Thermosporothrix hazakensis]PZW36419.1 FHA domain-containing protein [Thermosporothrix hazakensis]BBH88886.1 phosphopeptide-binding protein [Thermosporothrix sp. COM3]GCE47071.1 phosphopeptide-binding protein [Thermosporothrix hazakensis]
MALQIDSFLLILRILLVVLLYLFLMQVVIAITRDLKKNAAAGEGSSEPSGRIWGHLVVVNSGPTSLMPGTRFALQPQTNIGRGPTNTIPIQDQYISAEHTRMWFRNGTWYVQDAGSANGTYVNGQPARDPLPAKAGDIISVGYIQFKLTQ